MGEATLHVLRVGPNPADPEHRLFEIICPDEPEDMNRPCVTWWECPEACQAEYDDLEESGDEGNCAHSAAGYHSANVFSSAVAHPSRHCYPRAHDYWHDAAYDAVDGLPDGDYPFTWESDDELSFAMTLVTSTNAGS